MMVRVVAVRSMSPSQARSMALARADARAPDAWRASSFTELVHREPPTTEQHEPSNKMAHAAIIHRCRARDVRFVRSPMGQRSPLVRGPLRDKGASVPLPA